MSLPKPLTADFMQKIAKNRIADLRALVTDYLGMALALAGLIAYFGIKAENFFTLTTFRMIANQVPDITIVAVGMTFVLIIAGIDLSVGSVMAFAGAVLGRSLVESNIPLAAAIAACFVVGILCGAANGLVVIRWKLPPFIVTLGMLEIARGAAYLVTNSRTIYIGGAIEVITDISILGLSLPFIIAVVIVVAGQLVLSRTIFGRYLIAIGTNEEAVRLSGIDPAPLKLAVFVLCGFLTSVAAVIHTARLSSANPNAGYGLELQAIAAVVIGGTSLMGGRGSVVSSFFGVLIIAVLTAGLAQIGAQESTKRLITGCVIVAAVILDHYRHRIHKGRRHAQPTLSESRS
jgi:ribose transport system permease protein